MKITYINTKVICISNNNGQFKMALTIGKIYVATEHYEYSDGSSYRITNDIGINAAAYSTIHFKTLDEVRSEQIDKILE